MALDKDQICELLGEGLDPQVVADAVGTSTAYIGQLLTDDAFATRVAELRSKNLKDASERDKRWNKLEDRMIDKLEENVDMIFKPAEVLRAASMINRMQRRGIPSAANLAVTKQTVVQLTMPVQLVQNFTVNHQGEVVEVEGQTLVSMPATTLLQKLQQQTQGGEGERYKKVAGYLPGTGLETGTS